MMKRNLFMLAAALTTVAIALHAAVPLDPIHSKCSISASEVSDKFRLQIENGNCPSSSHCGFSNSDESISRFTGISLEDLSREGARLTATLAAEAGVFTCTGIVHDGELSGESIFAPAAAFVAKMEKMGFSGYDSDKLQVYAFLNVESDWVRSLQQVGIEGLTADKLIALRVFNVDPAYVKSMTALGYQLPTVDQLVALKCQGVNAQEVAEIRALGYKPTLDELIQMRIFKITPDFIHHMEDRGFKNLTIAKLVQIRIFKLAD
ncbi:MAG: hypothetical protein ABSD67_17295 [Terracidiphilus sp.]|jgi:hypothetical protein